MYKYYTHVTWYMLQIKWNCAVRLVLGRNKVTARNHRSYFYYSTGLQFYRRHHNFFIPLCRLNLCSSNELRISAWFIGLFSFFAKCQEFLFHATSNMSRIIIIIFIIIASIIFLVICVLLFLFLCSFLYCPLLLSLYVLLLCYWPLGCWYITLVNKNWIIIGRFFYFWII
jgi:hypothetical protein